MLQESRKPVLVFGNFQGMETQIVSIEEGTCTCCLPTSVADDSVWVTKATIYQKSPFLETLSEPITCNQTICFHYKGRHFLAEVVLKAL